MKPNVHRLQQTNTLPKCRCRRRGPLFFTVNLPDQRSGTTLGIGTAGGLRSAKVARWCQYG